ncbi:rod shape-determining protein MreD [Altererythrobacter sp. H2]|uniref:rod shape-determining protein MreD n=1 Tax=Altererythrobacter sp. H2 TaxID=3108391 RepID=UPI002B4BFECB|nr:rod shape-determining protein MreD [Altererythrobacter sp. H2]WRK94436.1 rod shape-determining protein MreD [Altererythrobacter sp. H2]
MTEKLNLQARRDRYGSRINRTHSPVLASSVPWISVLLGSFLQILPVASAVPLVPPTGFVILLCWRLVRPGLLPVWAGVPLGMFDDLLSGQPFGSAILLWSLALLAIELIEYRLPWREFTLDWLLACAMLVSYILLAALFSGARIGLPGLVALGPQALFSMLLYPIIARMVAFLDRLRLTRFKVVD